MRTQYGPETVTPDNKETGEMRVKLPSDISLIADILERRAKTGLISKSFVRSTLLDFEMADIIDVDLTIAELRSRGVEVNWRI